MSSPPPSLDHLALSATRLAAQLPRDLAFHRTIDDALRTDLDDLADRTHDLLSALLTLARPNAPVPLTTNPTSAPLTSPAAFKHVIDTVDWLLEGADDSLDVLTGKRRPPQISIHQPAAPPAPTRILPNPAPDNRDVPFAYDAFSHPYRRAITKLVVPAHVFDVLPAVHPKDTQAPTGTVPADNAASIPPLPTDPPSFHTVPVQLIDTPDAFDALIARLRRDVARAYPTSSSHTATNARGKATSANGSSAAAYEFLLALDLEHHSQHSYRGFVCLVQLTTRLRPLASSDTRTSQPEQTGPTSQVEQADYLLDALALRAHMHALNEFTADARIVKILHGAASDIPWLAENFVVPSGENREPSAQVRSGVSRDAQTMHGVSKDAQNKHGVSKETPAKHGVSKDTPAKHGVSKETPTKHGVSVVGMFDTYHAARALGLPSLSLAHLLKTYCGYEPDKRLARADWRVRPLPPTHLSYARSDTHFLPFIYDRLKQELAGVAPPTLPADPHGDGEVPAETPIDVSISSGGDVSLPNGEDAPDTALTTAPSTALTTVLQASARVCLRTPRWLTSATLPAAAMATARRAGRDNLLDEGSLDHAIYLALYRWRDATARAADEGVGTILPNSALLLIADKWRNLIAGNAHDLPNPTPTPLALAAPHAALASLVAPAALPAPVRLRAAEVVGVVVDAVRRWKPASPASAVGSDSTEKGVAVSNTSEGPREVVEKVEVKAAVQEKSIAVKTTPTPTASLFGRRPAAAASASSSFVAASSSSLFGGALGPRAPSSSLLGNTPSPTTATTTPTTSTTTATTAVASKSTLFGATLRAPSARPTPAPSPTTSLASIAARVHASFGVMPATPSSAPAVDADTSGASTAEHAFVPAAQRSTTSTTVFTSVKKGSGLTEDERKALADAEADDEDAMDDGEDDAMHEDTEPSGPDSNKVPKSGPRKSDKDGEKSKKDKKSKETSKAAPSVAADAIVAGAGARQKKRKRTKGPALDLSGEAAGASTSTSTLVAGSSASAQGAPDPSTPFDYASVPNILDAPGPSSTPTTERPRKKKRRVEEKGLHFRAPAPAPAEVRGVKVNLAHTFGK
ncbi:hypothetical protein FB107DRAFT_276319 [Schizophyllum commune]